MSADSAHEFEKANRLIDRIASLRSVAVAFSGGVDSSVVAAAASRAGLDVAIAVTAQSPSLASSQLEIAIRVANEIGIEHRVIETDEINQDAYRRNDGRRCFYCKQTLYQAMAAIAEQFPQLKIISGTNVDDLGDYRPGLEAAANAGVISPLADLGFTKSDVRELAKHFGLSNDDQPAAPCLASRVAYGTEVTAERLRRIEQAESWLATRGFTEFRVRLHDRELARVEVPKHQIAELIHLDTDGSMTNAFLSYGFKFVTIDTRGFRSGSLNEMLVSISIPATPLSIHSTGESES
ncbi:ATP-dependent sacrificial sulfur transferase LarE [Rubripirellula reticaptiva]|uniref:tRNA-specific 2-thiouridylase MnmA n=1 Tax=Rubripirellula reticaptiva TaxID=2528013 RepID=A0A5C6EPY3_9BACT|nr:ATP-dependent sacrificial sulfur transferase LarE [Rubripirellula reticaptiva]TWU51182.1 tRNA-specific 2-thiouridylase MnmA [Rubripirellula reticaptiva]